MSTNKAIVHKSAGVAELISAPIPTLRDDYINVKTKAVALNPTDWKSLHSRTVPGALSGCDYSGIVEEVGKAVTNGLKPGDRVAGFVHGAHKENLQDGTFAEHITAKGDMQIKIAENVTFEEAATLGVGITTVGQGLYQSLCLPLPPAKVKEPTSILIYGASTATGTLAVQFAKLSGCHVIATASPSNFDLVRKLGADQVFDYNSANVGAEIRKATNDNLGLVFDCISEGSSPAICAASIGSAGGKYSTLLYVKDFPRSDVSNALTVAYTAVGDAFSAGDYNIPAKPEDYEFAVKFWKVTERLLNEGKIKAHPVKVMEGGLAGIPAGLQELKDGKVRGVKLVYRIE
ncbi:oxidoreductase-like protein [Lepidopterella palustris CBS 459.81]|uniref:Oxidoreductase-like protein n=1 Tax=Lepidopterella palustris CBS 459.81 TaxID=1314670 RepID=A0A8E2DXW6_9PEZI|nr:oxidoreductase-like protein [Lepidopterella palustris CBS 459.81]